MQMAIAQRLQKLRLKLSEKGIPAIFISQPENRFYLSGFNGSAGFLLITRDRQLLATDFRYVEQVKREAPDYQLFQMSGEMAQWFPAFIEGLKLKELGFETEDVSFGAYNRLKNIAGQSQITLVPLEGLVENLRSIKEPEEIEFIRQAIAISDAAIEHIMNAARPGITELQMAWEIERYMREHGSQAVPFEVIVASGPNAALPHAKPSERMVHKREPIVVDIGAKARGYVSDLTRTICLGKPDAKFQQIYDIVLQAQLAAEEKIASGMSGAEADAIARSLIEKAGYGANFGHSLGHGLGLGPHEQPRLGINSKDVLMDNMVFTVEPGIYLPEWGGVRIEDTVMLENGKIRVLSGARK